jgi:anthranilate synthase/aminodeoxychorismate synthase-like glutamine amidotransferase
VHGKTDQIHHDGAGVFAGLPDPFTATRYHSLVVDEALPGCLALTAWNDEGIVMGVSHRELPVHGVQFHPESVLTEVGLDLLATFLRMSAADGGVGGVAQPAAAGEEAVDAE